VKAKTAHILLLAVLVIVLPLLLHASVPRGRTVRVEGENIRVLRGGDYLEHFYLQILPSAQERIWVVTYSLSPADTRRMESVYDKLQEKHEQGVDVRLLLPAELGEETARQLQKEYDFTIKHYAGEETMHVKTILVDDQHVYSGSANFTVSGFGRPSESTIYLKDPELSKQIEKYVSHLWEVENNEK
jgi:phosphatidylserine/phosphatidylglycerophosphate/cardiolipin synthase-like enzyme